MALEEGEGRDCCCPRRREIFTIVFNEIDEEDSRMVVLVLDQHFFVLVGDSARRPVTNISSR